jgi:hypothetical protein
MPGRSARIGRRLDTLAVVGLVGWLAFDLTARTVFGSVPWPDSVVDYRILYDSSRHIVATHRYPDYPYPYPPPSVAVQAAGTALPYSIAAAVWLGLTGLAAAAGYYALARVLGLHHRPGRLAVLPLAHVVVAYYFQWDMRSANSNLLVFAAVMFGCAALAAGRDAAGGFWFALAVALKVMPVLILPYLAWTRRWRALAWACGFSLVFWVGVPLVAFGADGLRSVYADWAAELTRAASANVNTHPILISLHKAASHVAGDNASAARAIVLGVCGLWVGVGLAGAAACWGGRPRDGYAILTHVSLLILGPVAVNPYLEPYHLIPLAVPAVLLLAAAVDAHQSKQVRLVSVVGFVAGMAILKASSPWPLRGLLVNAQALVMCGTAVWVAWARVASAVPDETAPDEPVRSTAAGRFLRRLVPRPGSR